MLEHSVHKETTKINRRSFLKAGLALPFGLSLAVSNIHAQELNDPHLRITIVTGSDNPITLDQMAAYRYSIPSALTEAQSWYATQLEGQTFRFDPDLKTRTISLTTDQIRCGLNPLSECLTDKRKVVEQAWQAAFWNDSSQRPSIALTKNIADIYFVRGAGEQARGGTLGSAIAGYVVIGNLGLEGLSAIPDPLSLTCAESPHSQQWQCTRQSAVATLAHEIGHLVVTHNSHDEATLMGGNIGNGLTENGLDESEKPLFKQSIFFQHRI